MAVTRSDILATNVSVPVAEDDGSLLLLKRRNEELERELRKSQDREERTRAELERVLKRLRVAEDGEERLCSQLGELEAEAIEQASADHARIMSLVNQLSQAQRLLKSAGAVSLIPFEFAAK